MNDNDIDRKICEALDPVPPRNDEGEFPEGWWQPTRDRDLFVSPSGLWDIWLGDIDHKDLSTWDGAGALFEAVTRAPRYWWIETQTRHYAEEPAFAVVVEIYGKEKVGEMRGTGCGSSWPLALRAAVAYALGIKDEIRARRET